MSANKTKPDYIITGEKEFKSATWVELKDGRVIAFDLYLSAYVHHVRDYHQLPSQPVSMRDIFIDNPYETLAPILVEGIDRTIACGTYGLEVEPEGVVKILEFGVKIAGSLKEKPKHLPPDHTTQTLASMLKGLGRINKWMPGL